MNDRGVGKALTWLWLIGTDYLPGLDFRVAAFEGLRQVLTPVSGGGG